tara:strand:- start:2434 stop:9252 length:6819 start_codon:yes stop_codon:yes gene_type:complete
MAELKRTFVKGGMNLDLDERLVGQGLYREAINIRVSSSSEGNEGSLETVKGSFLVAPGDLWDHQLGFGPRNTFGRTVGTAVDKTNDKAYHFIQQHVYVNFLQQEPEGSFSNRDVAIIADAIYEYIPTGGAAAGDIDLVFNDVYEIRTVVESTNVDDNGSYIQLPAGGLQDLDIREDMRILQGQAAIGNPLLVNDYVDGAALNGNHRDPSNLGIDAFYVDYVDRATDRVYVKDDQGVFGASLAGAMQYATFRSKRILNFDLANRYITGINVFDGLIFFTDGKHEPKKINIKRSKVGTLSAVSVYPDWISDRRFFHTRLLLENIDNIAGFRGVPYYDFFGNIDNGTGGVIESHCTVIRPNPEEHLKVLTDVGEVIVEDTRITGSRKAVMTHPFPIHPVWGQGKILQFVVAFANENAFYDEAGNLMYAGSASGASINFVDDYYNLNFLFGGGNFAQAEVQETRNSLCLDVPDALAYANFANSLGGPNAIGNGGEPVTPTEGVGGGTHASGQWEVGGPNEMTADSLVYPAYGQGNVAGAGNGDGETNNPYPLFYKYLNTGLHKYEQVWPIFSLIDPSVENLIAPGPMAVAGNIDFDSSLNLDDLALGDIWVLYAGTAATRGGDALNVPHANPNSNVLTYFEPTASFTGANSNIAETAAAMYDFALNTDNHPINQSYHLGGILGATNVVGGEQNLATVSNYWGLGGDPEGPLRDYVHNGRIDLDENNLYRPTGPGRFVVQPHGFEVGDIVILEGQGNTRHDMTVGRYTDVDVDGNEFYTPASVLSRGGSMFGGVNPADWSILNQGHQDSLPGSSVQHSNLSDPAGNGVTNFRYATRKHDGFADRVKAKIVGIEHVNMRDSGYTVNGINVAANEDGTDGWKDNLGNSYNDLRNKFIFLRDEFVGNLINDGTPDVVHDVTLDDGSEVSLQPSFFSTSHYASQYIITISIEENNLKTDLDPTLRVDLSNRHIEEVQGASGGSLVGEGDGRKNAAMLPLDYNDRKSPYWNRNDLGWGFYSNSGGGIAYDSQDNPKYYGPPLPQVWSVSAISEVDGDYGGRLTDEKALREAMLRFTYRYQYEDNEYSGLAPFTTVIWRTLNQKIDWPNYYISLINEIKNLRLIDWRPKNLPQDVRAVELFVKSEEANNIYSVKKYDYRDGEFNLPANGSYTGLHPFNSNTLGLTLDPNQILRPFDSVPRSAKAQEVSANRIIYGNYLKDYNLDESAADVVNNEFATIDTNIKVDLEVGLSTYVNQIQGEVIGPDGNPISVGVSSDDGAIEIFEEAYSGVNANFGVPQESIKSYRSYQIGIVYRDELGRETPVLTNRRAVIKVSPEDAKKTQRITVAVKTPHPTWAKSYKFFIKDISLDYHVLPLEQIRHFVQTDSDDDTSVEAINAGLTSKSNSILVFSSDHRNKVQEGDILIQKRAHRKSGSPDPVLSNVTNHYEPDNLTLEYEVQKIRNEAPDELTPDLGLEADDDAEFEGKFFVFVNTDRPLIVNNDIGQLPGPNTAKTQAVFETLPKPNYDVDLYYEASQAYPIVLDDETDEQFVKVGRMVEAYRYTAFIGDVGGALGLNSAAVIGDTVFPQLYTNDSDGDGGVSIFDTEVTPITVVSVRTNVGRHSINDDLFTEIKLSAPVTLTVPANPDQLVLKIQEHRGSRLNVGEYIYVTLAQSVVDSDTILVRRHTHLSNFSLTNNIVTPIALPYYNCFCFGNGIEISTAKNSFNGARIQKGVKASSIYDDYAQVKVGEGLIFSGIYNSYSSFNETNQFIEALGITKRFNPDHGDVQKLFSRSNDLLVLCEDKVLKVLANKDAIFKADSNPDLIATNRVLGQSIAFDGEYGISNNPESFAHYGFRSYFTDSKRGVVIRLSKDGMTIISDQGMDSYFKNHLWNTRQIHLDNQPSLRKYIFGSYNIDKGEYLVSGTGFTLLNIEDPIEEGLTVAWDESLNAWTSFRTYTTIGQGYSLKNQYFTPFTTRIYHHDNPGDFGQYGIHDGYHSGQPNRFHDPRVAVVYNELPGTVKDFTYANYEGTQARIEQDYNDGYLSTNADRSGWWISSIRSDLEAGMSINFKNKENKWHNYLMPLGVITRQVPAIDYDFERFIVVGEPVGFETDTGIGGNSLRIKFLANNVLEPDDQFGANYVNTGRVDLSQINPDWGIFLLRLPDGFEDGTEEGSTTINPGSWENLGLVAGLAPNTDHGFSETHIDTTQLSNEQWAVITADPLFDGTYTLDINGPRYLIALAPLVTEKAGGVKGYYARTVWRNNDYENKSELFATALNAIESSK